MAEEIVEPTPVQINELPRAATNKTSRADRQELTNQETHRPVRSTPGTLVFHCGLVLASAFVRDSVQVAPGGAENTL